MSSTYIERITCDNPDCLVYADELVQEIPGQYEVREYVRSLSVTCDWSRGNGWDLCPTHASTIEWPTRSRIDGAAAHGCTASRDPSLRDMEWFFMTIPQGFRQIRPACTARTGRAPDVHHKV
jgi:hypothetical protein